MTCMMQPCAWARTCEMLAMGGWRSPSGTYLCALVLCGCWSVAGRVDFAGVICMYVGMCMCM